MAAQRKPRKRRKGRPARPGGARRRGARPPAEAAGETERVFFGDVVRARGWAGPAQILECLDRQRREDQAGRPHRLIGEIMVERGYLTRAQLRAALELMR